MSGNTARLKAYDFAADAAKQELTIASATIALGATFLKDIYKTPHLSAAIFCALGFILLVISLVFGVRTLFLVVGCLANVETDDALGTPIITAQDKLINVARNQHIFFVAGLACLVLFGVISAIACALWGCT
jgi:hypothetical protein